MERPWNVDDWSGIIGKASWAMTATVSVMVGLRIFTRGRYGRAMGTHRLGMDDVYAAVCVAFFIGTSVMLSIGVGYGVGRHAAEITPPERTIQAHKWNAFLSALLIWTFSMPKFAVVGTMERYLEYSTRTSVLFWGLAISSQLCILTSSVIGFVQCRPVEKSWDRTIRGDCSDFHALKHLGIFISVYSAVLDIVFAVYPVRFILRLHLPATNRALVLSAVGFGLSAGAVSLYKAAEFGHFFDIMMADMTYGIIVPDLLGLIEGTLIMIALCVPTLGPLYQVIRGQRSRQTARKSPRISSRSSHGDDRALSLEAFRALHLDDPDRANGAGRGLPRRHSTEIIPLGLPKGFGAGSSRTTCHHTSDFGGAIGTHAGGISVHRTVTVSSERLGRRNVNAPAEDCEDDDEWDCQQKQRAVNKVHFEV